MNLPAKMDRESVAAWLREVGNDGAIYLHVPYMADAVLALVAAQRAAALEAAAKVCDGSVSIDEADEEWNDACEGCAHKIRTLAKEPA